MTYTISSNEFSDNLVGLCMPSRTRSLTYETILKRHGNVNWTCFNTGHGLIYCSLNALFHNDTRIEERVDDDYLFFAFNQGASAFVRNVSKDRNIHINRRQCFSGQMREGHHAYGLYAKGEMHSTHFILIDQTFLQSFCLENEKLIGDPSVCPMFESTYCTLHRTQGINREQCALLHHLSHTSHALDDSFQALYLESKILELAYATFAPNSSVKQATSDQEIRLSSDDVKSLEKAKKLLLSSLQNPPSIKELAYKSAINEFKLKKGFKTFFGTTIYGMLHEHRLEQAKTLLQHNDMSVQEAAQMVGYKSFSHFSKIFKDRYGMLPVHARSYKQMFYM